MSKPIMNIVVSRYCQRDMVSQIKNLVEMLRNIFKDEYEIIVLPRENAHIETSDNKVVYVTIDDSINVEEFVNKMKEYAKKMGRIEHARIR